MLRTPSVEQAPLLIQKLMIKPPNATWPHCVAALARERPRKLELLAVHILNHFFVICIGAKLQLFSAINSRNA